jgi:hypothetical protein
VNRCSELVATLEVKDKENIPMALRFAAEPKNGTTLVQNSLQRLAKAKNPLSERGLTAGSLAVQPPHAVYDLRADEVAAGKGLAAAHPAGFRYLIGPQEAPVAAAEVIADASSTAKLVTNVNYGPFVAASAHALQKAGKLSEAHAGNYEVRLLRFTAIAALALWLKSDAGGADILYPLAPVPAPLQAEKPYTEQEFLAAIMIAP